MSANESLYRWVKLSKHCADTGDTRTAVRTDLPLISQPKRPPMRTRYAHDLRAVPDSALAKANPTRRIRGMIHPTHPWN